MSIRFRRFDLTVAAGATRAFLSRDTGRCVKLSHNKATAMAYIAARAYKRATSNLSVGSLDIREEDSGRKGTCRQYYDNASEVGEGPHLRYRPRVSQHTKGEALSKREAERTVCDLEALWMEACTFSTFRSDPFVPAALISCSK